MKIVVLSSCPTNLPDCKMRTMISSTDPTSGFARNANLDTLLSNLINQVIAADIVPVIAAGNDGLPQGLDIARVLSERVPTALGVSTVPIVTVGGVYNNGYLWEKTTYVLCTHSVPCIHSVSCTHSVLCTHSCSPEI
jgi:hypothetical protein